MKYVGLAFDPETYTMYALREDGAIYEINWDQGVVNARPLLKLPEPGVETGPK